MRYATTGHRTPCTNRRILSKCITGPLDTIAIRSKLKYKPGSNGLVLLTQGNIEYGPRIKILYCKDVVIRAFGETVAACIFRTSL